MIALSGVAQTFPRLSCEGSQGRHLVKDLVCRCFRISRAKSSRGIASTHPLCTRLRQEHRRYNRTRRKCLNPLQVQIRNRVSTWIMIVVMASTGTFPDVLSLYSTVYRLKRYTRMLHYPRGCQISTQWLSRCLASCLRFRIHCHPQELHDQAWGTPMTCR